MSLGEVLLSLRRDVQSATLWRRHRQLAASGQEQKETFEKLRSQFQPMYQKLAAFKADAYLTEGWKGYNAKLEAALCPDPPFDFLKNPTLIFTMFVSGGGAPLRKELVDLEKHLPVQELERILAEDSVGSPTLLAPKYRTSHNSVHHLYHLIRFEKGTGCRINQLTSVIEWGGGYGNLAKIFWRASNRQPTYTIIDTPLLTCLQWLYLATTLGENRVHLIEEPDQPVEEGKINLIPVAFLPHQKLQAELFISTWALSESSVYSQDWVIQKNWFSAKRLLLAYHDNYKELPDSERVAQAAFARGAQLEEIDFLPGNHYAFQGGTECHTS